MFFFLGFLDKEWRDEEGEWISMHLLRTRTLYDICPKTRGENHGKNHVRQSSYRISDLGSSNIENFFTFKCLCCLCRRDKSRSLFPIYSPLQNHQFFFKMIHNKKVFLQALLLESYVLLINLFIYFALPLHERSFPRIIVLFITNFSDIKCNCTIYLS